MKYFSMPSDFKIETIDQYLNIHDKYKHSKVIETYGQLAPDTVFGSGRHPKDLPKIDMNALEKYVKYSKDRDIEFNYTLNTTCNSNDELTKVGYLKIKELVNNLQGIGVNWVTISLPTMIDIVKHVAPTMNIKTSTLSQINSPMKAQYYDELGVKRIVLDEDIHRRFDLLKNIRNAYSGEIEIIVNSYCVNDCPLKNAHFNNFSQSNTNKRVFPYFYSRCLGIHIEPEKYLKLNWIRPEDIHYYSEIGIHYFKIQGRTNVSSGNPAKALAYYIEEKYDGNLISLLELFSESKPFTISGTTIDNRKLDGFFEAFVKNPTFCTKVCKECSYCDKYAKASITAPDRILSDEELRSFILYEFNEKMNEWNET